MEEIKTPISLENLTSLEESSPLKMSRNYQFLQRFGERKPADSMDDDLITSLSFDKTGNHLAVGDHAGRIVVFKFIPKYDEMFEEITNDQFSSSCMSNSGRCTTCDKKFSVSFEYDGMDLTSDFEFEYVHDFQSHEKEVDFLHNKEIPPQINNIKWLHANGKELRLIVSNSKSIKLWKIKEGTRKDSFSLGDTASFSSKLQKSFFKLHDYAINSLSVAANEEIFLSSDDLKVNLWDLNEPSKPYNLIDMTPLDIDDLSEVITSCNFHPRHDNIFVFGSSQGNIRVGDLRKNGVCDKACQILKSNHTIYKEIEDYMAIVRSLSDCRFLREDHIIIARDYLNIFEWDVRNDKSPLQIIPIFEPLKKKLNHLLKNEQIFDQFSMAVDSSQRKILTGNYDDSFHLIDLEDQKNYKYKIIEDEVSCVNLSKEEKKEDFKSWNFENKILKADSHPKKKCLAVACQNCLYLFKK